MIAARGRLPAVLLLLAGCARPALSQVVEAPVDKRLIVEDGRYEESAWTRQLAVTADDRYLISSDTSHGVRVFDLLTGSLVNSMEGHALEGDAYYDARAGILVTTGDRTIKIWDVPRQRLLKQIRQAFHSQFMHNVYVDSRRRYVFAQGLKYSFSTGNVIKVHQKTDIMGLEPRYFFRDRYYAFNTKTGEVRGYDCFQDTLAASYTLDKFREGIDVYFDAAAGRLFIGYEDGVRIVDIATGRSDFASFSRKGAYRNLDQTATYAISADGNYLVAGSNQGVGLIVVKKVAAGAGFAGNTREVLRQRIPTVGEIHPLYASNKVVYSVGEAIHLLNLETLRPEWRTEWKTVRPRNIHLAPDGAEVYIDFGSRPRVNALWFERTFTHRFDDYFDTIDGPWGSFKPGLVESDLPADLVGMWRERSYTMRMPLNRDVRLEPPAATRPFPSFGTGTDSEDKAVTSPSGRYRLDVKGFGPSVVYDRGRPIGRSRDLGVVYHVEYSPDERYVALGGSYRVVDVIDLATGRLVRGLNAESYITTITFSRDSEYVFTGSLKNEILMWRLKDGRLMRRFVGSNGSIADTEISADGKHLLSIAGDGALRFWSAATGELLSSVLFPVPSPTQQGTSAQVPWVVVAPDGRFDTSNLDEIRGLHWIMLDDPLRPLPLEIFMRDYYEPRLLGRVLGGEKLPALPRLDQLNRAQPAVLVRDVSIDDDKAGLVSVTVEVGTQTLAVERAGGPHEYQSGAYDLRLFREGQMVAQWPDTVAQSDAADQTRDQELAAWRRTHAIELDPGTGRRTITFRGIRLPRRQGLAQVEFSAYAFNVDRVKSATARSRVAVPKTLVPRPGRAYVVTIGVNAFEGGLMRPLSYAANDARQFAAVLAEKLGAVTDPATGRRLFGGSHVIPVTLVTELGEGDRQSTLAVNHATKDRISAVFEKLAGKTVAPERLAGVANANLLEQAQPEDLVIVAFSTHGDTDRRGQFYLMPHDLGTSREDASIRQHAISSEELSVWLRTLDAGELVIIVDACHSAATVESGDFKPGPMGSRGLGQLAFDKGMRILAASQRDQYALETETTRQGLLSYALVREGLGDEAADMEPRDRRIHLAEWLRYGADRVPGLYRDFREGKLKARAATPLDEPEGKNFISIQQPALFDFARNRDTLIGTVSGSR